MFEKKLIIINSAKDIFINQKNIFYINIGDGNTSILNSKKISLRDYRKTYYEDRELKPKEDLFFTITLFPLTSLDQKIDQSLYRDD